MLRLRRFWKKFCFEYHWANCWFELHSLELLDCRLKCISKALIFSIRSGNLNSLGSYHGNKNFLPGKKYLTYYEIDHEVTLLLMSTLWIPTSFGKCRISRKKGWRYLEIGLSHLIRRFWRREESHKTYFNFYKRCITPRCLFYRNESIWQVTNAKYMISRCQKIKFENI